MKVVTAFETQDGLLFSLRCSAEEHEAGLNRLHDLIEYVEKCDDLIVADSSVGLVSAEQLAMWIDRHSISLGAIL